MNESDFTLSVADEHAMERLGAAVAQASQPGLVLFLHGNLGAGKTTFARGFLHGLGHEGAVRSPTYTLIEPYEPAGQPVYHLDLYRLADPEELEFLGVRDLLTAQARLLVEWPEQGSGLLPEPDLTVSIAYAEHAGRRVHVAAASPSGAAVVRGLVHTYGSGPDS